MLFSYDIFYFVFIFFYFTTIPQSLSSLFSPLFSTGIKLSLSWVHFNDLQCFFQGLIKSPSCFFFQLYTYPKIYLHYFSSAKSNTFFQTVNVHTLHNVTIIHLFFTFLLNLPSFVDQFSVLLTS